MAIYHLSAKPIRRSHGESAVAAAAYRAGEKLYDARRSQVQDYSRKRGVVSSEIITPDHAPGWTRNREELWNKAEAAEKRKDAQPAREIRLALPDELTDEQRADLVYDYVNDVFVSSGMIADVSIHRPDRHGDERNHHTHILLTMRELDGEEFSARKNTDWNKIETLSYWREQWQEYQNRALEDADSDARVDHRSLEAQGIRREPTTHVGKAANAMERKGQRTERGDINREIEARNRNVDALVSEYAAIEAEIARELDRGVLRGHPSQEEAPAFSWEVQKQEAQNPIHSNIVKAFEAQLAMYEPENSFAFLADREPALEEQTVLAWEEVRFRAQDPIESEITKEFESQIRKYGEVKEYGVGTNWFDKTLVKFANVYYDTAQMVKDTWQEYVVNRYRGRSNDPDRDIEPDR